MMMCERKYEVFQIDAIAYDDGWTWNDSFKLGEFETRADNTGRAFTAWLRKKGITFRKGCTFGESDFDGYTIMERSTRRPLFHAREICPF